MAPKACTVVVHDLNDTAHQLDVTAETLYEAVAQALASLSFYGHFNSIIKGVIDLRDVLYFAMLIGFFLIATSTALEAHKAD